jgi:hypothetical protein
MTTLITCCSLNGPGLEVERYLAKADGVVRHLKYRPYEDGLHHAVAEFLAGNYDYWLNVDDDNPPRCEPLELRELDLDIIGCPTPMMPQKRILGNAPFGWNVFRYAGPSGYGHHPGGSGLQEVDAVSSGCMLIARRVFEHSSLSRGAFARKIDDDGFVCRGTDIAFCERAKDAGFTVFAHWDYPCGHFKTVDLLDIHERTHAFVRARTVDWLKQQGIDATPLEL